MKILFITNFCPLYHYSSFKLLSQELNIKFVFYESGANYHNGKNTLNELDFDNVTFSNEISKIYYLFKLIRSNDIIIYSCTGGYLLILTHLFCTIFKRKKIFWSNNWYYGKNIKSRITKFVHSIIYRNVDAIVTYGEHVDKFIIENFERIDINKIFHSYNVTNNNLFREIDQNITRKLKQDFSIQHDTIVFGYVGRLDKEKGVEYLLKAYKLVRNEKTRLILVGQNNISLKLQDDDIFLIPFINNKLLPNYYSIFDVLILPSITGKNWKEPWGIVINESMNQECALIATTAVGAAMSGKFTIRENINIVSEKSVDELAKAISEMISDKTISENMKKKNKILINELNEQLFTSGFTNAINYVTKN